METMPRRIKTAYEMASRRYIKSASSEEYARLERKQAELEKQRLDYPMEFIKDHKSPFDDKDPKDEYADAFVEKNKNNHVKIEKDELGDDFVIKEPEVIHYDRIPELHWYGNFTSYTGFSKMNRAMVFGLSNKNVKMKIDMQECPIEVNQSTLKELERLSCNEIDDSAPKVFGATIPLKFLHNGRKILYTMMENSETLHNDYVEKLNMFNEIWVPTHFNKKVFEKNKVRSPIFVMPLGVDTDRYNENAEPFDFKFALNEFVFISVFKWNYRKGWDILLKSFLEEFDSSEPVSLLIVSRTDVHHNRKVILQDFIDARNSVSKDNSKLPHIALYDEPIREKDMPSIYRRANSFVLISRGEGFGLPYCEAASCGLPVIASNCSGQMDYLTKENSFLVDPDGYSKAAVNGNMSRLAKHCRFYEEQIFPEFKRPAIDATKSHMRYVYENYDAALRKAKKLTKRIQNRYSWDDAVDNVYNRVRNIE